MINAELQTLHDPDGHPVCNVVFDLSAGQLAAASHAAGEMVVERHRGQTLETDDVLALRELTGLRDELGSLAEAGGHGTMILPLARFIVLHDVLDEYVTTRSGRDWARKADKDALPLVGALLHPMAELRRRALAAVLRAGAASA